MDRGRNQEGKKRKRGTGRGFFVLAQLLEHVSIASYTSSTKYWNLTENKVRTGDRNRL
jgi:hypothetical protein